MNKKDVATLMVLYTLLFFTVFSTICFLVQQ